MRSDSRPRQQMPLPEPSPSLWRAIPFSLSIVVTLILLPAIAFASPPDPSWIAGIYDGADGDDIVSLIYETLATNAVAVAHTGKLPRRPSIPIERITPSLRCSQLASAPRAPPITCSTVSAHVAPLRACSTLNAHATKLALFARPRTRQRSFSWERTSP